jgi:hypothetical protein
LVIGDIWHAVQELNMVRDDNEDVEAMHTDEDSTKRPGDGKKRTNLPW